MSPNRLVIQRWWGLPLTLLNKIGQPPSNCFWMPVISRSGSTSLSVTRMSPSFFIHSMALRKSRTSSAAAPSLCAFAIVFLRIFYVFCKLRFLRSRKKNDSDFINSNFLDPIGQQIWGKILRFRMSGRSKCIYDNFLKVNERSNDTRTRSRQSYAGNGTFVPRDQSAFGRSDPLQLADGLLSLPELFLDLLGRIYDGRCSTF